MTLLSGQYTLHIELQIVLKLECYRSFWPSKVSRFGPDFKRDGQGQMSIATVMISLVEKQLFLKKVFFNQ